jgi:AcrR family transcriptional regulator
MAAVAEVVAPQSVRAKLLESAKRAFGRHGYASATVQHILDEANVTRRTFYRYFSSKDDVFAELLDGLVDVLCANVSIASDEPSLRARLHARTSSALRIAAKNRAFLRAVDEAILVNGDHARRWDRLQRVVEDQHRAALGWCIAHGIMDEADTALLARILTGIVRSVLLDIGAYGTTDAAVLESTVVDVYWNLLFRPHEGAEDYVLERRGPRAVFAARSKR